MSAAPVIGVITQVFRDYKRYSERKKFHLPSSYVKWIEASGGQVMPIMLNRDDHYYEQVFKQTNGLLLPGGDNLLDPNKATPLMQAARKLYRLAVDANKRGDFYPIWGTCLGMELLTVLESGKNTLAKCDAEDVSLPVEFVRRGELFAPSGYANVLATADFSGAIMVAMARSDMNVTFNAHQRCVTDTSLGQAGLANFYRPLGYSWDKNGLKFVAIMEAVEYPFFGVQFHPEKPAFEFETSQVPHSGAAIAVGRYLADFFVGQARRSAHRVVAPADQQKLRASLIYAHDALYTSKVKPDMYEQRYLFAFVPSPNTTDCEFINHRVPAADDKADEEVCAETAS